MNTNSEQEIRLDFEFTRDMAFEWEFCERYRTGITFMAWLKEIVKTKIPKEYKLLDVYYQERDVYYYHPRVYYYARPLTNDEKITECLEFLITNLPLLPNPFKAKDERYNRTNKSDTCAACQKQADGTKTKYCSRCHRRT